MLKVIDELPGKKLIQKVRKKQFFSFETKSTKNFIEQLISPFIPVDF